MIMTNISGNPEYSGIDSGESTDLKEEAPFANGVVIWLENERLFSKNQPCMVYLITMVVIGIVGNGTVLYVYTAKFKKNTANFFILLLALFDILAGLLLCFEVFDRRFPMYSGKSLALCKSLRLIEATVNLCSLDILVCIGFDRYYKICHPMKSFTKRQARRLILVVVSIAPFVTWPMAIFHGPKKIETGYKEAFGLDCADDDNFSHSILQTVYFAILSVLYLIFFGLLIGLYIKVYIAIWRWKKSQIGEDVDKIQSKLVHMSISEKISANKESLQESEVFYVEKNVANISFDSISVKSLELCVPNLIDSKDVPKTEEKNNDICSQQNGHVPTNPSYKTIIMCSTENLSTKAFNEQMPKETCDLTTISHTINTSDKSVTCNANKENLHMNSQDLASGDKENFRENNDLDDTLSENDDVFLDLTSSCGKYNVKNDGMEQQEMNDKDFQDRGIIMNGVVANGEVKPIGRSEKNTNAQEKNKYANDKNLTENAQVGSNTGEKLNKSESPPRKMSKSVSISSSSLRMQTDNVQEMPMSFMSRRRSSRKSLRSRSAKSSASLLQTTLIFAVISGVLIISYVPYFIIELMNAIGVLSPDKVLQLVLWKQQVITLFNSSFCLNNAVNPLIYSILSPQFRHELRNLFTGGRSTKT